MGPFRLGQPRFLAYFALEGGLIFAVLYGLANATARWWSLPPSPGMLHAVVISGVLFSAILLFTQGANLGDQASLRREVLIYALVCVFFGGLAYATTWFLLGSQRQLYSLLLLEGAVVVPGVVAAWRWTSVRYNVFNPTRENVLIVGSGEIARQVCHWIVNHHSSEYGVLGFAHEDSSRNGQVLTMGARIQTDYQGLTRFALPRADRVIVALEEKRGRFPVRQLMELRLRGVEIEEATSFFERISGRISVETMLPSWLIFSEGFKTSALRSVLKRLADILISSVLLVLAAPLMLFTVIAVVLDSGFPVFYRQSRLGRDGGEFDVIKFRSMRQNAEAGMGPTWAQRNDPRVTRVGRFIRLTRIDELPQLITVLKGEMSFVGPRPERAHFVRQLETKIPYYGLRLTARPGLTGWAQVQYRYGASEEDALEKLKYDLYYIKNNNLLLDLWIVLKTVGVVLRGSGAH